MQTKEKTILLSEFMKEFERIKEMFPEVEKVYFVKPLDVLKYRGYNCADMHIGINLREQKIIGTDGDWMSSHTEHSFDKITEKGFNTYTPQLASMKKEDLSEKDTWSRKACEEYYMKVINSGEGYEEIVFQAAFIWCTLLRARSILSLFFNI